ncbi:unnamed protein product [Cochlearia groenlandica]
MARRGRRKNPGLMREDAARDAMRDYGFEERVINVSIKELLEVYSEDGWFLIEEFSYRVLLNKCLEMQEEHAKQLANEQDVQIAEQEPQEEEEEEEEAKEQQVEDGRDHVVSSSASSVGCVAETGTKNCQTDALSITDEAIVEPSPTAFQSGEAPLDYAQHAVEGGNSCGWLSEEEEEETDSGDDDEMIPLTPEPLCEELEELLREVRGEKKRKRPTRWDN